MGNPNSLRGRFKGSSSLGNPSAQNPGFATLRGWQSLAGWRISTGPTGSTAGPTGSTAIAIALLRYGAGAILGLGLGFGGNAGPSLGQSLPSPIFPAPIEAIQADFSFDLPFNLSSYSPTADQSILAADRLQGSWQWRSEDGATTIYLTFDGVDRVIFRVEGAEELQLLSELLYHVDLDPDPWSLDLTLGEDQVIQTIFRFSTEKTADQPDRLELELSQLSPGQPRPLAFGDSTLSFDRLGEVPPLPDGAVLLSYEDQQRQQQEGTALSQLKLLAQAQSVYYQDQATFAENWEEFVLGILPETTTYRYGVEVMEPTIVVLTAQAKGNNTRSYSSLLVATVLESGETRFSWHLCATAGPSQGLPPIPDLVAGPRAAGATEAAASGAGPQFLCAPGSVPLAF